MRLFLDSSTNCNQRVEDFSLAVLEAWWTQLCTRLLNRLETNAGSIFKSPRRKQLTEGCGLKLRIAGVEAQISLETVERLHETLRRVYREVKKNFPHVSKHIPRKPAVQKLNHTFGEVEFVPPFLVLE